MMLLIWLVPINKSEREYDMAEQPSHFVTKENVVLFGLAGILGSLVLFIGDMLFYFNGEQSNLIVNMAHASSERIILSGLCAMLAAWLYTLAAGQIYYAFQPAGRWIHTTVFLSFTAIMIAYGIVHAAYLAIAVSAKNAVEMGLTPNSLTDLAITSNHVLRYLVYVPFGVFTLSFIPAVWTGKTRFPRWIVFFSPIIPFLLKNFIVGNLTGSLRVIIAGGYLNLILLLFFAGTTTALIFSKK
jgi:hypothetical protein